MWQKQTCYALSHSDWNHNRKSFHQKVYTDMCLFTNGNKIERRFFWYLFKINWNECTCTGTAWILPWTAIANNANYEEKNDNRSMFPSSLVVSWTLALGLSDRSLLEDCRENPSLFRQTRSWLKSKRRDDDPALLSSQSKSTISVLM